MQTVITYYKNLTRWDVKSYLFFSDLFFEQAQRLSEFIKPYKQEISHKEVVSKKYRIISKINFSGELFLREPEEIENYKGKLFLVPTKTIIFSKINAKHGCIFFNSREPFVVSSEYPIFTINDDIDGKFLWLYLRSGQIKNQLGASSAGMAKVRTSQDNFLDLRVKIPPLKIQEKIVSDWRKAQKEAQELNKKADEKEKSVDVVISKELGIANQNNIKRSGVFCINFANLERWDVAYNAKELLTSKKAKYDWIKLKKYCETAQYGYTGSAVEKDTGAKFLRITDLDYSGNYQEENLPFVQISNNDKQKYFLNKNDFVVARTGATAGKCAIIKKHNSDVVFASYLIRFKFTKDIDLTFLEQYLNQGPGKRIVSEIVYSSGQPNINANEIQEIKIPLPPLPKQREIAKKVETIRAEIAEIKGKSDGILEITQKVIGKMLKA